MALAPTARDEQEKNNKKTAWQIFTNNGNFDNKLPPSQRFHLSKGIV